MNIITEQVSFFDRGNGFAGAFRLALILLIMGSVLDLSSCRTDTSPASLVKTLKVPIESGGIDVLAWSPDGTLLASGGSDGQIDLWAVPGYELISTFKGQHIQDLASLVWSPDGTQLASTGWDGLLRVWDVTTGLQIASLGHEVRAVAWSPDGDHLAGYVFDPENIKTTIQFWSTDQFDLSTTVPAQNIEAWNPVDNLVASYDESDNIQIWDVDTSQIIKKFEGHHRQGEYDHLGPLVWSPDGTMVASSDGDGLVKIWLAKTGQGVLTLGNGNPAGLYSEVVWSPDGNLLAINNRENIEIWDVATGQLRVTYFAPTSFRFYAPKWSPDTQKLAAAAVPLIPDEWGQLWVWNVNTNQALVNNRYRYLSQYPSFEWHPNQAIARNCSFLHRSRKLGI